MKRKLTALIMSIFIIFMNLCYTYQASANPIVWPALLIGGELLGLDAMAGMSSMMATQGVTFDSPTSGRNAVAELLYRMPEITRQRYINTFESDLYKADLAIRVAPDVWNYVLEYVNGLEIGENIRKALDISVNSDGTITEPKAGTIANPYKFLSGNLYLLEIDGGIYINEPAYWNGANEQQVFISGLRGSVDDYSVKLASCSFVDKYDYYTYSCLANIYNSSGNVVKTISWYIMTYTAIGGTVADLVTTTGVADSYYDYTRSGVAIPVPQIENGDRIIAVPQSIPYTGSVGITGEMCIPDALTVTDAITDAELDLSETDVDTIEKKINWKPLKRMGNIFTTRFPFSLPWDLLKVFKALLIDSPKAPVWNIAWHDDFLHKDFSFVIDLKKYDTLFKISRGFILAGMIVGLIMGTRKLLGGAT